jgi:hypothetical protein
MLFLGMGVTSGYHICVGTGTGQFVDEYPWHVFLRRIRERREIASRLSSEHFIDKDYGGVGACAIKGALVFRSEEKPMLSLRS